MFAVNVLSILRSSDMKMDSWTSNIFAMVFEANLLLLLLVSCSVMHCCFAACSLFQYYVCVQLYFTDLHTDWARNLHF